MNTTQLAQSRLARSESIPVTFRVGERFYNMLIHVAWCCYCCSRVFKSIFAFGFNQSQNDSGSIAEISLWKGRGITGSWIWLVTGDSVTGDKSESFFLPLKIWLTIELLEQRSQIKIQKKNRCVRCLKETLDHRRCFFLIWVDFRLFSMLVCTNCLRRHNVSNRHLWQLSLLLLLVHLISHPESSYIPFH